MYSLRGRLLYGAAALVGGAWLLSTGHALGWVLLAVPALLAWGFFRYGPMVVAFRAYHEQNWPALAAHLRTVRHPSLLSSDNRAYFALLSGVSAFKAGEVQRARELLASVAIEQLRTDNMRAILECHRAEVALAAGAAAAELTAVQWLRLDDADWPAAIMNDPYLFPQLVRLRGALSDRSASQTAPSNEL